LAHAEPPHRQMEAGIMSTDFPGLGPYSKLEEAADRVARAFLNQPNTSVEEFNASRDHYVDAVRQWDLYRSARATDDVGRRNDGLLDSPYGGQSTPRNIRSWQDHARRHSFVAGEKNLWIEDQPNPHSPASSFDPYSHRRNR